MSVQSAKENLDRTKSRLKEARAKIKGLEREVERANTEWFSQRLRAKSKPYRLPVKR